VPLTANTYLSPFFTIRPESIQGYLALTVTVAAALDTGVCVPAGCAGDAIRKTMAATTTTTRLMLGLLTLRWSRPLLPPRPTGLEPGSLPLPFNHAVIAKHIADDHRKASKDGKIRRRTREAEGHATVEREPVGHGLHEAAVNREHPSA